MVAPLGRNRPAVISLVAKDRVLKKRAVQSHLSSLGPMRSTASFMNSFVAILAVREQQRGNWDLLGSQPCAMVCYLFG